MSGRSPPPLSESLLWKQTDFYYTRYLVYVALIFIIQYVQIRRGKAIQSAVIPETTLFSSILFIFHAYDAYSVVTFFVFVYLGLETAAWFYVDSGITFRFLAALEPSFALWMAPVQFSALLLGIVSLTAIVVFPFLGSSVTIRRRYIIGAGIAAIISLPFVVEDEMNTLYPFRYVDGKPTPAYHRINNAFNGPWNATLRPGYKKKNLILVEIESFESKVVGKFNSRYPKSMPYLSSLTDHAVYFTNMKQQPYNTWSAAGMFVVQCGFPLVANDVWWQARWHGGFEGFKPIKCVPDILRQFGYKLYGFCSQSCDLMNMKGFLKSRGYLMQDPRESQITGGDGPLFEMLRTKTLPQLQKNGDPFVMLILTDDTHFTDHVISPLCDDYLAREKYPKILRAFTCVDQMVQKLVEKVKELGMDNDTEVVVFGDHLTMSKTRSLGPLAQRSLSVFFPLHEQDEAWKVSSSQAHTYYDISPTIIDLLGIDHSPPFPFGSSMMKPGKGLIPVTNDLKQIYRLVTGNESLAQVRCHGTSGFCGGVEH